MQEPRGCGSCCVCCGVRAAKYRCPGCRVRYCSVTCCKKHKEQCVPRGDPGQPPAGTESSHGIRKEELISAEGSFWTVDDILTEDEEDDKVPLQKLELLKGSEELKEILLNPHLRQLLLTVDQVEDKNTLMKKYMQEPLFAEFADCCLRIIEPPEKENELPE